MNIDTATDIKNNYEIILLKNPHIRGLICAKNNSCTRKLMHNLNISEEIAQYYSFLSIIQLFLSI